jgi:hypothetical protein
VLSPWDAVDHAAPSWATPFVMVARVMVPASSAMKQLVVEGQLTAVGRPGDASMVMREPHADPDVSLTTPPPMSTT